MKKLIFQTILISVLTFSVRAEDFRKWTDVESGRQVEGVMKDKKIDESEVQILLKSGKTVWMESSQLAEGDRTYIKNWIKPVKHLTCRIVGFSKGSKRIKVVAVSGSRDLKVIAYKHAGEKDPLTKNVKAGEEIEFEYQATNEYVIKAWSGKDLVDEESWKKKTGL